MRKNMTCIVCPLGCSLDVTADETGKISVSGNTCPKGAEYAENECTNPIRTVTSTVKCENGNPVPVKTDRPVPKENMKDVIKILSDVIIPLPISVGDVIISDVFGCNIVATANMQ